MTGIDDSTQGSASPISGEPVRKPSGSPKRNLVVVALLLLATVAGVRAISRPAAEVAAEKAARIAEVEHRVTECATGEGNTAAAVVELTSPFPTTTEIEVRVRFLFDGERIGIGSTTLKAVEPGEAVSVGVGDELPFTPQVLGCEVDDIRTSQ